MPLAFDLDRPTGVPEPQLVALLGGKAANLAVMSTELGLPVPPAFAISTDACRAYLAGRWPDGLDAELRAHMRDIEEHVGRRFGDPANPLLVSVRSGAPVSMPGMMDTILDLGLNAATEAGLARASGDPAFAASCRQRFEATYLDVVGAAAPEDPWLQLRGAIEAVFRSWNGDRARAYRRHEGIADDMGTGVTVQAMVFGNGGADSATGVLFTRNPATGEPVLYGDILFDAQGEDVVAGDHATEQVTVLDERMPEVARELRHHAAVLERHFRDVCDIEFTIEHGRLWMLQVRIGKRSPRAALRIAVDLAQDPAYGCSREEAVRRVAGLLADPPRISVPRPDARVPLAIGLPASPGVASGEIVTTPEEAESAAAAGRRVVLVRFETSPEDVAGMASSVGVLTARGGLASHAAVVARGWGIPAVVGVASLLVEDRHVALDGRRLDAGDVITIDGGTGEVFEGDVSGSTVIAPEATTLLAWARELGIQIGPGEPSRATEGLHDAGAATAAGPGALPAGGDEPIGGQPDPAPEAPRESPAAGPPVDEVERALMIRGLVGAEALAIATDSTVERVVSIADGLVGDGLAERVAGAYRLTARGKLRALDLFTADRDALGAARAEAALDAFHPLDLRVKDAVTGWQVRAGTAEPTLNDHTDASYDADVLDRLSALHADTIAWLTPLASALPRLDRYRARLIRALHLARAGDGRFVASPRVDSYHTVWFELHEDLIRLAGRRRADEVEADRA